MERNGYSKSDKYKPWRICGGGTFIRYFNNNSEGRGAFTKDLVMVKSVGEGAEGHLLKTFSTSPGSRGVS